MFRFPPQHNQSQDSLNEHTPILSHKGTVEYFIPVANTGSRGDSHHSWRECSKKSVQQGRSHFDARSVHGVREHGKMATCLRVAASAKAGNAAGGFFQHSNK